MKNLGGILILFIALSSCSGKDQNELKRYDVKSGIIKYTTTISGKVMGSTVKGSGTESLSFKDWGAIELVEEETKQTNEVNFFGVKNTETTETHSIVKIDNGKVYQVDFDKKKITLSHSVAMDYMKQSNRDVGETGKSLMESMGGQKIGEEKMLGYACEIWEVMGAKQWMYKGIVLKAEANVLGIKTIKEATSAEFNISVSDTHFALPDFPVQEIEGFMDSEGFKKGMDEMDENMEKIGKMSYKEWKNKFVLQDDELKLLSEEELHQTYDMIQKMIKMRKGD